VSGSCGALVREMRCSHLRSLFDGYECVEIGIILVSFETSISKSVLNVLLPVEGRASWAPCSIRLPASSLQSDQGRGTKKEKGRKNRQALIPPFGNDDVQ
jgi:hypothetical protein